MADLHCRSFYPTSVFPFSCLLRADRVSAITTGLDLVQKELGQFACLKAESSSGAHDIEVEPKPARHPLLGWLHGSVPPPSGPPKDLVGVLVVDNLCEHLPRRQAPIAPRAAKRNNIAYISNVCIEPAARRRGVARTLVREAEALAAQWGCRSIALHVEPENVAALGLYEGMGYRVHPRFSEYDWSFGGPRRLLLMMKSVRQVPGRVVAGAA